MEQLFTEEAKRMWEKQDKTWEAEKNARKKLMEDVLNTLGEQTKTKTSKPKLLDQTSRPDKRSNQSLKSLSLPELGTASPL